MSIKYIYHSTPATLLHLLNYAITHKPIVWQQNNAQNHSVKPQIMLTLNNRSQWLCLWHCYMGWEFTNCWYPRTVTYNRLLSMAWRKNIYIRETPEARLVHADRNAMVTLITTLYNCTEQNSISECTCRTLRQQQKTETRVGTGSLNLKRMFPTPCGNHTMKNWSCPESGAVTVW